MRNGRLSKIVSLISASYVGFCSAGAQANGSWAPLEIIDMTTSGAVRAHEALSTAFFDDMDLAVLDEPVLSVSSGGGLLLDQEASNKTGWSGFVEVELTEIPALPFEGTSKYSNTLAAFDEETKLRGFYSMRYQFNSDARFRPYAAAGLGLVGSATETEAAGIIAGRATAGFDLTLGKKSALFAEYAVLKNGGVNLGKAGEASTSLSTPPDLEHSVKLGFRRAF